MKPIRKRLLGVAAGLSAVAVAVPVSTASAAATAPAVAPVTVPGWGGWGLWGGAGWGGVGGPVSPYVGPSVWGGAAVIGPTIITTAPSSFNNTNNQVSAGGNWSGGQVG